MEDGKMTIKEIILRISRMRIEANLSARALSLEIGKTEGYIHLLESERSFEPSLSALLDMIEVCGKTPEEFFYHDPEQFKKDQELLEFFKTLSPRQKDAILNLYKK